MAIFHMLMINEVWPFRFTRRRGVL